MVAADEEFVMPAKTEVFDEFTADILITVVDMSFSQYLFVAIAASLCRQLTKHWTDVRFEFPTTNIESGTPPRKLKIVAFDSSRYWLDAPLNDTPEPVRSGRAAPVWDTTRSRLLVHELTFPDPSVLTPDR